MSSDTGEPTERERRLEEVLAGCLRAAEGGATLDREEVLARHPDLAGELREVFANPDALGPFAEPLPAARRGGRGGWAGGGRHVAGGGAPRLGTGEEGGLLGGLRAAGEDRRGGHGGRLKAPPAEPQPRRRPEDDPRGAAGVGRRHPPLLHRGG